MLTFISKIRFKFNVQKISVGKGFKKFIWARTRLRIQPGLKSLIRFWTKIIRIRNTGYKRYI
jgi:hypothetical protein